MDTYRHGLGEHLPLVAREFFATFSRFEFALKRGGFLSGDLDKPAGPNWDAFANTLGDDFFKAMKTAPQAQILFEDRPKKLMVVAPGEIAFEAPAAIANSQTLFEALRLVRNNLFHGEKAYVGNRDELLMRASLFVLDSAFNAALQRPDCKQMTLAFAYAGIGPH